MDAVGTYLVVPFISGLFNVLIDRLATEKMKELLIGRDSTNLKLAELSSSMKLIEQVVRDVENKRDDEPLVEGWLDSVKHAIYDAEDLIDEIQTEALQQRTELETQSVQSVTQVFSRITVNLGRIADSMDPFFKGIESRIEDMIKIFKELTQLIEVCGLKPNLEKCQHPLSSRSQTTPSALDESKIYGRDSEREQIINVLQDGVPKVYDQDIWPGKRTHIPPAAAIEKGIRVVAIVGMPGIGKTTLAQLIFNDPRVGEIFNLKAWICVSEKFDRLKMIRPILLSSLQLDTDEYEKYLKLIEILNTQSGGSATDLNTFDGILRKKVTGKRFLIVLDDVWDEDFDDSWRVLYDSLQSAAAGSTIIATTQNMDIAKRFHPVFTLKLQELSDDDCWSLIKERAFGDPHAALDESLEDIGRRIAAKCRGLPLAAKALAGLLADTPEREWENVENDRIWHLLPVRKKIIPALLLSYNFLPPRLRRCFAYCSMFPKNYQFQKEKLLMLWMAEGLINPATSDNQATRDCFDMLLARSFFQESTSNRHCFLMHDLIRELAVHVMGEFGFMLEANTSCVVSGIPRHFTHKQCQYETIDRFGRIAHSDVSKTLRTFLPLRSSSKEPLYCLSREMLQSIVQSFGHLRVLSLCGYNITIIPPSINSLKHLRYLDFSSTLIEELPETLCSLYNLQTLLLSDCCRLKLLPSKSRNLIQMHHLDISGTKMLEGMPEGIGRLSRLQMLTDFVVGKNRGVSIGELEGLEHLKGCLRISGLENVVAEKDAKAAKLIGKRHLDELVLEQGEGSSVSNGQCEILQALKPHANLIRLSIVNYKAERFPDWVGDVAFRHLEVMHLRQCRHCAELPTLGHLRKLKHLVVDGFDQLQTVGSNFYREQNSSSNISFESLQSLRFLGLPHWEEWFVFEVEDSQFPCLQELYVWDCPELNGRLPLELPSLKVLNIRNCPKLCGSLPQSPLLRELSLRDCGRADLRGLASLTCLTSLSLHWDRDRPSNDQIATVKAVIPHLTSLDSLSLKQGDSSMPSDELTREWSIPLSVRSLSTTGLHEIQSLLVNTLHYLHVNNSDSRSLLFPSGYLQMLNYLRILNFCNLQEIQIIPDEHRSELSELTSLYDLSIEGCPQLSTFPVERFKARNLTTLSIADCSALELLGDKLNKCFPSLRFLSVEGCPQLESFDRYHLPPVLQTLRLWRCENLKSLFATSTISMSLELLDIAKCAKLESIPVLPYKLQNLKISGCETLKSLPNNMCTSLLRLDLLVISDCPQLSIPPGVLPRNLRVLHVRNCKKLIQNQVRWQLHGMTFLKELVIEGFDGQGTFPENGSLPPSLTIFSMVAFSRLGSINCMELKRLACLRELEIRGCQALQKFSEDLPESLCRLTIQECPLLSASPDVRSISHIPCLLLEPSSAFPLGSSSLLCDFFGYPLY